MPDMPDASIEASCERLVWQMNPRSLLEQPAIDARSWAGAIQHELRAFGVDAALRTPPAPATPCAFVGVVMMVKDEADIIGENLTWLHRSGVRRFVLIDNASADDTPNIIRRFRERHRDAEVVVVADPILRYMQAEKTTGAVRLATSIWPDLRWVVPVDADEFLVCEKGFGVLDTVEAEVDALSIPKVIHFRRDASGGEHAGAMARMDLRSTLFTVPPKVILRGNALATLTQGNHKLSFGDRVPVYGGGFARGMYYREYPTRSFEHFLRKTRNGGRAILAAQQYLGRGVGGEHWIAAYRELVDGGEETLLAVYRRDWIRTEGAGFTVDPFVVDASELK